MGEQALEFFIQLYEIEREVRELEPDERKRRRQEDSHQVADALHLWLIAQRQKVPKGSATAKAIDYSLKRWRVLTRFIDDGGLQAAAAPAPAAVVRLLVLLCQPEDAPERLIDPERIEYGALPSGPITGGGHLTRADSCGVPTAR